MTPSIQHQISRQTPARFSVLGVTNAEVIAHPCAVSFPDHHAAFRITPDGPEEYIHYTGEKQLHWGGKAVAETDLKPFAGREGFNRQNGGGLRNTAVELVRALPGSAITAWDTSRVFPEIATEFSGLGIEHRPLGLHPAGNNVVLTRGRPSPSRVCLCAPVARDAGAEVAAPDFGFTAAGGVAVINSCKHAGITRAFSDAARQSRMAQYSVVNRALSVADRLELQIDRDAASCCNLDEFADLAPGLAGTPDANEENANLEHVARAVAEFGADHPGGGDLAITLGCRGTLIADRALGLIAHIALKPDHLKAVWRRLRRRPDLVLGSGDRFFADFLASHATFRGDRGNFSLALTAALRGSIGVVRTFGAPARPDWFEIRIFPARFAK